MIPESLLGEAIQAGVGVLALIALIVIAVNNNLNMRAMISLAGSIASTSASIEKALKKLDEDAEQSREHMRQVAADLQTRLETMKAALDGLPEDLRQQLIDDIDNAIRPALEAQARSEQVLSGIEGKVTAVIQTVQLMSQAMTKQDERGQVMSEKVQVLDNTLGDMLSILGTIQADIHDLKATASGTQLETERLAARIEAATVGA